MIAWLLHKMSEGPIPSDPPAGADTAAPPAAPLSGGAS
jgi:hypothetical protein